MNECHRYMKESSTLMSVAGGGLSNIATGNYESLQAVKVAIIGAAIGFLVNLILSYTYKFLKKWIKTSFERWWRKRSKR